MGVTADDMDDGVHKRSDSKLSVRRFTPSTSSSSSSSWSSSSLCSSSSSRDNDRDADADADAAYDDRCDRAGDAQTDAAALETVEEIEADTVAEAEAVAVCVCACMKSVGRAAADANESNTEFRFEWHRDDDADTDTDDEANGFERVECGELSELVVDEVDVAYRACVPHTGCSDDGSGGGNDWTAPASNAGRVATAHAAADAEAASRQSRLT